MAEPSTGVIADRLDRLSDQVERGFTELTTEVRKINGRVSTIERERYAEGVVQDERDKQSARVEARRSGWRPDLKTIVAFLAFLAVFIPTVIELGR